MSITEELEAQYAAAYEARETAPKEYALAAAALIQHLQEQRHAAVQRRDEVDLREEFAFFTSRVIC